MRDSNSRDTTNRAIDEGKNQDVLFRADDDRHVMHDGKLVGKSLIGLCWVGNQQLQKIRGLIIPPGYSANWLVSQT